jgi:hypothetical protein
VSQNKVRWWIAAQAALHRRRRRPPLRTSSDDFPARARLQRRRRKWPAAPEAASRFADTAMVTPAVAAPAGAPQWQRFAIEAPDDGECGLTLHDFVLPHQALIVDAAPARLFSSLRHATFSFRFHRSSLPSLAGNVRHGQINSFSRRSCASEFCQPQRQSKKDSPPAKKPREAKRRKAQSSHWPRRPNKRCRLPRPARGSALFSGRARLPALHRGSDRSALTLGSAQAALHATKRMRALPAPSIALKRSTSHAGRNAGGDDARTARERLAKPPAGTTLAPHVGSHPDASLG